MKSQYLFQKTFLISNIKKTDLPSKKKIQAGSTPPTSMPIIADIENPTYNMVEISGDTQASIDAKHMLFMSSKPLYQDC